MSTVIKEVAKAYLKSIVRFIGARWISPRDSHEDSECAVTEVDLDLTPDALNYLGAFLLLLRKHDPRVNTDHPVFQYLGRQAENREDAAVTFTISVRRRKTAADGGAEK
jgi:hypothetical protein